MQMQDSPHKPLLPLLFSSQVKWSTGGNRRHQPPSLLQSYTLNGLKTLASKFLVTEKLEICKFLALSLVQTLMEYSPE